MNKLDKDYQALLQDILDNGVQKEDRTGTGTLSVFGRQIRHKMSDGFPALTTKKFAFKTMITELTWFLRGDTNIKYLVDNGCNIWNGDTYKKYCKIASSVEEPDYDIHVDDPRQNCTRLMTKEEFVNKIKTDDEFAKKWGDLGPVYGKQWRDWNGKYKLTEEDNSNFDKWNQNLHRNGIDQIQNLINDLKTNPDSRRLMVNAWNVSEISTMTLPPCHYGFQVYTRPTTREEKIVNPGKYRAISLKFDMRSVDTFLGMPFDIASYGALLHVIAKEVNMIPDELIAFFGDTHLYLNHLEQAREQITREPYLLPQLEITDDVVWKDGDCLPHYEPGDFKLIGYQSHPAIKALLSN